MSVEPFGKDHSTRGGSYDTGVRISREVFDWEPPHGIAYEWISLKGHGDMSSSKGNVLSIADALEVVPPEALRYLVMREKPSRTISFDPGEPLLALVDEIEAAGEGAPNRALELSRAAGFRPVGVPFKHLVVVAQAARFDLDLVLANLARAGDPNLDRAAVAERIEYARRWLDEFAPADLKFEVSTELPEVAKTLTAPQRVFLDRVAERLDPTLDAEAVHKLIYEIAGSVDGLRPADGFQAIYLALLGKTKGPRAGWFVTVLGTAFCAARFREAAAA